MSETRVSTYPLPPMQYINNYTDERLLNRTAPPPPPPLDSNYVMFGVQCTKEDAVIHSLESQGLRRLYPPLYDHKLELKTLNFSILANFLDLIDILIKCPDSPERLQKLEHIKILFINMHHLINEYRPLQARDTLVEMLIHQGGVTRQTADTASKYLSKVNAIIAKATSELPSEADALAVCAEFDRILLAAADEPAVNSGNRRADEEAIEGSSLDGIAAIADESADEDDNGDEDMLAEDELEEEDDDLVAVADGAGAAEALTDAAMATGADAHGGDLGGAPSWAPGEDAELDSLLLDSPDGQQ